MTSQQQKFEDTTLCSYVYVQFLINECEEYLKDIFKLPFAANIALQTFGILAVISPHAS